MFPTIIWDWSQSTHDNLLVCLGKETQNKHDFFVRLAFIHKETDVEIKIPMACMTERFFVV